MLILLYKGTSLTSRLIRWFNWSKYSHATIVPSDGFASHLAMGSMHDYLATCTMYEAWHRGPVGVMARCGISEHHTPGTAVDVFATSSDIDTYAAQQFLLEQVGKAYDFRGVLGFVSRRDGAENQDRWFCSELVFAACLAGGLHLLRRIAPHRVSPGALALSPELRYLGTAQTGAHPIWMQTEERSKTPQNASQESDVPTHAETKHSTMQPPAARMQTHCAPRPAKKAHRITSPALSAANSAAGNPLAGANASVLAHSSFQIMQDGLFIPFGDYPNIAYDAKGNEYMVLQRWDLDAANQVIADLNADANGRPIYRGHPDVPAMKDDWPDKDAKGWIHSAQVTTFDGANGVKFIPKYNDEGTEIITQAKLKFPSPYWNFKVLAANSDGSYTVAPKMLVSMGLLNNPNIPVPAVANQAPPQPGNDVATKEDAMREQLIAMLKAAGVEVPEDITDEALMELAKTTLQTANAAADEAAQAVAAADQAKTEAEEKEKAEAINAANARATAAGAIVDLAVVQGKIPQAKRADWLGKFKDNFAAANGAVQLLDTVLDVSGSQTGDLGKRNAKVQEGELDAANARAQFVALVAEEKGRLRGTMSAANSTQIHELAWGNVRRKHATLYATAYLQTKKEASA